jgi:dephospho-CoA kinase
MLKVGLTGGLASGKSFVGRTLADLGCLLIQADELGHKVLESGAEAYQPVIDLFGTEILSPDATIDRRKLAAKVFNDPERLKQLNALVHPPVRARSKALLDAFESEHPSGVAVIEAAILIETGGFRSYDRLIVAVCTPDQQIERSMSRDHLTRDEVLARMSRQMPLEEKVKFADYVIDTSGTKEHSIVQTRAIYETLRSSSGTKTMPLEKGD